MMEKTEIFSKVQKCLESVPVILVGTGATIPLNIPGMKELSDHIIISLDEKYRTNSTWNEFAKKLNDGTDLESALTDIVLNKEITDDIVIETWKLISQADRKVFLQSIFEHKSLALAELINKFYQVHPKCVNIITTNYDRVIEYACDQKKIKVDTKYQGNYVKYFSNSTFNTRETVNLLKVHGSLDLFKDSSGLVYSIPLQNNIPSGFIPEIITPGLFKYKAVLTGDCRDILHASDTVIDNANSFLCIGYGFNDEQIQAKIITEIRSGKPITVVTKTISDKAAHLLANNSNNYVVIEENPDKSNSTRFTINRNYEYLDDTYWTINGLLKIF